MPELRETYSADRLDDLSRRVYFKALTAAEKFIDEGQIGDRLHALAAIADATGCGMKDDDEETI